MRPAIRVLFPAFLLLLGSAAIADKPGFSGSYTLTKIKGGNFQVKKGSVWTMDVVQTAAVIQVTKVRNGKKFVNTILLDGTEGLCEGLDGITPEGMTKVGGRCKGHFKERYLYLESFVVFQSKVSWPKRFHVTERWELSPDLKTLTVRVDLDINNAESGQILFNTFLPRSEVYARN
ncbi:MAG TPA: hypothetical protein VN982_17010 [Candidatus Dormibacteraeota bacterium]|nr:hypothetical protein [Candidatus Dormibacteraeota bacterium]